MRVKLRHITVLGLALAVLVSRNTILNAQWGGHGGGISVGIGGGGMQFGYSDGGRGHGGAYYGGGWGGGPGYTGYNSHYGSGWGYNPGVGWGVSVPLGDSGRISVGNYPRYYGNPYYGSGWGYGRYGYGPSNYYGSLNQGYYQNYGSAYSTQAGSDYAQANQEALVQQDQPPPLPTAKDFAKFTDEQLRAFIGWVATGFIKELGQYKTGETWVVYFRLNELKTLDTSSSTATAKTGETVAAVGPLTFKDVLANLDSASQNEEYKMIGDLWGFKALHLAMQEVVKSGDQRMPGVLKGQAEILSKSLAGIPNGEGWIKYLDLQTLEKLNADEIIKSNEQLPKIAAKFDSAANNPGFKIVTQLPGFQGIHDTLRKLSVGLPPPPPPSPPTAEGTSM
jgi:hypothetical protein